MRKFELKRQCGASVSIKNRCIWRQGVLGKLGGVIMAWIVERLPFANETFDKALAINSMQIWPDPVAALRQMQLVLKPGGAIALAFTPYSEQSKEGLTELVTAAGFTGVHMLNLGREFYVFAFNRTAWRADGACGNQP